MGKKLERVYEALLEGAADGLSGAELYDHVSHNCPSTSSKRIVRASLLALSDEDVKDRKVLEAIYGLAIDYRLKSLGVEEDSHEDDDDAPDLPAMSDALRNRLQSSTAVDAISADAAGPA